jgi:hypothetical protein
VPDLEAIEDTLDLLSAPGEVDDIREAEAEIARGEAIGADHRADVYRTRYAGDRAVFEARRRPML